MFDSMTTAIEPSTTPAAQPESQPKVPAPAEEKLLLANPPHVPYGVLRLIVNLLTARECSRDTFVRISQLICDLSFIPDAREVIASELRTRAQEFGQTSFNALDELEKALLFVTLSQSPS